MYAVLLIGLVKKGDDVTVKLLGGDMKIKWDDSVYMTGNAVTVFEGEFLERNGLL